MQFPLEIVIGTVPSDTVFIGGTDRRMFTTPTKKYTIAEFYETRHIPIPNKTYIGVVSKYRQDNIHIMRLCLWDDCKYPLGTRLVPVGFTYVEPSLPVYVGFAVDIVSDRPILTIFDNNVRVSKHRLVSEAESLEMLML